MKLAPERGVFFTHHARSFARSNGPAALYTRQEETFDYPETSFRSHIL